MDETQPAVKLYCPRCDREYVGDKYETTLAVVKKHVSLQHPDHDPEWADDPIIESENT